MFGFRWVQVSRPVCAYLVLGVSHGQNSKVQAQVHPLSIDGRGWGLLHGGYAREGQFQLRYQPPRRELRPGECLRWSFSLPVPIHSTFRRALTKIAKELTSRWFPLPLQ